MAPSHESAVTSTERLDRSALVAQWNPEDEQLWASGGSRLAWRNLWVSVYALLLSFSVNTLAALVSSSLGSAGFSFSAQQLFLLTAIPGLIGATGRLFFTYCPARFGGRNFTFVMTAFMLIPLIGIGLAVQNPQTSFGMFCFWFALLGLSLSNFSASMANIGYFFPKAVKGTANGLNAGIGNLGVALAYFVVPIVLGLGWGLGSAQMGEAGTQIYLQNACFVWVIPVLIALVLIALFMDNLELPRQSFHELTSIFSNKHTWFMTIIYTCSFGSFIGYSMALALITKSAFPEVDASMMMFLGPLLGAALRPVGGWLSDRIGSGARITFVSLIVMFAATLLVLAGLAQHNFTLFFGSFLVLFVTTGLINGASFRMIPHIFEDRHQASQVTGFTAAIAAYGAFIVPVLFRSDYQLALGILATFTFATLILTAVVYLRMDC